MNLLWITLLLLLGLQYCRAFVPSTSSPETDTFTPPDTSTSSSSSTGRKPNIFLIVADDLGWNDVPWHNPDIVAPNILSLARDGIILDRSYVQPICTPSRSALMAGKYPFTLGRQSGVLRPMEPTGLTMEAAPLLPEVLKDLGYSTHAVGKWHLGFCNWKYTPTKRGFDTFYGYYNGAEGYFSHWRSDLASCYPPSYVNETTLDGACDSAVSQLPDECAMKGGYDFRRNKEPDFSVNRTYSTYAFASYVENLLASRDPNDPFFLYMPFQSVHSPLEVPENYTEPYKNIQCQARRTYCGMVTAMDEAIGRMVAALKHTVHYDNTIIVFTTDNGGPVTHGANNWPLRGSKTTYWEGGTRGSAFLHSPLLPHTKFVSNKLVHLVDWYPTLIGLAGGKVKDDRDGFNVWEALTSPDASVPSPRTRMVYNIDQTKEFRAALRMGDYKLIIGNPGEGHWTPPPKLFSHDTNIPENFTEFEEKEEDKKEYENGNEDGKQKKEEIEEYEIEMEIREDDHGNSIFFIEEVSQDIEIWKSEDKAIQEDTNEIPFRSLEPLSSGKKRIAEENKRSKSRKSKKYPKKDKKMKKKPKQHDRAIDTKKSSYSGPVILDIESHTFNNMNSVDNLSDMTNIEPLLLKKNEKSEEKTTAALLEEGFKNYEEEENTLVNVTSQRNDTIANVAQEIPIGSPFPTLEEFLDRLKKNNTKIQLYNVQDDPEERMDLSQKLKKIVAKILVYLHFELERYVPADIKKPSEKADPKYWDRVWTPGWC